MKKCYKSICFIMVVVSCLTVAACKKKDDGNSGGGDLSEINRVVSNKYVVRNGMSDYYIVLPENAMEKETFAATEFAYIIKEATGASIPVISEKEVKSSYKYISLGETTQFENAFSDVDLSQLYGTQSAYFISTLGNNMYIASGKEHYGAGTLYGVYDLLNEMVGYKYYHDTEIYFEEKDSVNLLKYDEEIVKPTFDTRTITTMYIYTNDTHATRLRLITFESKEWNRTTVGHGQIALFVPNNEIGADGKELGESHPEWFVYPKAEVLPKGQMLQNQLCWSAGDELETYVAEKMKTYLAEDTEAKYFMFGQEDNSIVCSCDKCKANLSDWAGTYGGLQVAFMNNVLKKVKPWIEENQPGRDVKFVIYAYHNTQDAPIKQGGDGEYIPYSDKVIPDDDLMIELCPIFANYSYSFDSPVNKEFANALDGWSVVAKNKLLIYTYFTNYTHNFANINNFGTVASMLNDYKSKGVSYVITQGASDSNVPCFDEMRSYVESNLMWNLNQNYETLAKDFMVHYYKEAGDSMFKVYEMIRDRYTWFQAAVSVSSGSLTGDIYDNRLYTVQFINQLDKQIDLALASIDALKESDTEKYTTLKNRILKEELPIIYLKMRLYPDYYGDAEKDEMKEVWEYYTNYYGITKDSEGNDLPTLFD